MGDVDMMTAAVQIAAALGLSEQPAGETGEAGSEDAARIQAALQDLVPPATLAQALEGIRRAGSAVGRESEGEALAQRMQERWDRVREQAAAAPEKPRTLLLSEIDPPLSAGLWNPELLEIAGGVKAPWDAAGAPAGEVRWEDIVAFAPETIILILNGSDAHEAIDEAEALSELPGWYDLPAVRAGDCYSADARTFFDSPGPRLAEAAEILATILHPETFTEMLPPYSVRIMPPSLLERPKE